MLRNEKHYWPSKTAFILAAIGSAIGLGNIWRFPYICYKFGGGAFLFAYLVSLIIVGIPLLILEFGIGQKIGGSAPLAMGKINKKFSWIGWFAVLCGFLITTYYAVIMSWSANYLIHSFTLAWGNDPSTFFYKDVLGIPSMDMLTNGPGIKIFSIGTPKLALIIGLVFMWIGIILSIWKGARTVGKIVFFTVTIPWLILVIMVIGGLTLPGAFEGIRYYLTPDWKALQNPVLWQAAFTQVFFSLTVGFGVMIAYASFLPPKSDIVNNALIIALSDAATAFIGGFAVFAVLGHYAMAQGVSVGEVMSSGPGLAFVTYPAIINNLPLGPIIGVLFFLMLLTLAIDSAFSLVEGFVAGIMETFRLRRLHANLLVAILGLIGGLIFTTSVGLFWLDILDTYVTFLGLFAVGFLEALVVGWFMNTDKMRVLINEHSYIKLGKWWNYTIKFVVPIVSIILLILSIISRIKATQSFIQAWSDLIGGIIPLILALVIGILLGRMTSKAIEKYQGGKI